jgi:hypothetical protein
MGVTGDAVEKPSEKKAAWERPASIQFPIESSIIYRLIGTRTMGAVGRGRTIDISSKAITFMAESDLPIGAAVKLYIEWPNDSVQIRLVACGRLTCGDRAAAILEIARYEFRTKRARALDSVNSP